MEHHLPRLLIAAPASGHGKTTIASGLMAALRRRGSDVAGFKVGPDYIDPGYHRLATGRPGRNLDPVLCGTERIAPMLLHGAGVLHDAGGADLAVIEGVMGLFDGKLGSDGFGSSAHVAALTRTPVVLVVDISHTSRTVAAWVHGLATFDPEVNVVGVILNKAGSSRHAVEATRAMESVGVPVLGVLGRDAGVSAPSRHLGLVPVAERDEAAEVLERLADEITEAIDLPAVESLACKASPLAGAPWAAETEVFRVSDDEPVVAVAGGRAFTFRYAETDELLTAAGCRVVEFDPLRDDQLPEGTAGLYLGGGFPEVYAEALAGNVTLSHDIATKVLAGLPTVAECAGMLYLGSKLGDHPMAGVLPATGAMQARLTLGYRTGIAPQDSLLGPAGTRVVGHEFHRTAMHPAAGSPPAWLLDGRADGHANSTLHASYLHLHWAGHPQLAQRFAESVAGKESR
ncbi:cobyrinate a,c-diamide synthase [Naumannella sp. ID2617S]|nr:cobyrinate a,c-diamide synthase [Naumannella sp. ID2617S]